MLKIQFSNNWNGKLLNDAFTTIRIYNPTKYPDFQKFEVEYKGKYLGIVEIESKRIFKFGDINAMMSWVDIGRDDVYAISLFKKFYKEINASTSMYMLALRWVTRDKEAVEQLFKERFEHVSEQWLKPHTDSQTQIPYENTTV